MTPAETLAKVDWSLCDVSDEHRAWLTRCIEHGDLVFSAASLGWALWPTANRGFYDARLLRVLADFIEAQNRPWEEEYERHCAAVAAEPMSDDEVADLVRSDFK